MGIAGGDPVRVFISYAHGSDEHVERVRDLWIFLRAQRIDAKLDRAAAQRRQDWALWMADQVREADHILIVASAAYRERAEGRSGPDVGRGVQYEARLIRDAFYANQDNLDRFVPVVLPGQSKAGVPDFLTPATSTVYTVDEFSVTGMEALLRLLLNQPEETEPPLGLQSPVFGRRDHSLSLPAQQLAHEFALRLSVAGNGQVRTETLLAGTVLGEQTAVLPPGLVAWQAELASPTGDARLVVLGQALWRALLDDATSARLLELIDHSPWGSVVDVVVELPEEVSWLPVELLQLPDGRLAATAPGVRLSRRLAGVQRPPAAALPGPLKILAAVAAPEETLTSSPPLDVEAEMQALLDAVTDLDADDGVAAQVRILEVASLAEIGRALAADQYHVLHLSAHGSATTVELEDEDGHPVTADADRLVAALRAGERPLPLVVLSSCRGAETGTAGLAAALVRHGADRVVAMQASVTDRFATALARELYHQLARDVGMTVTQALAAARREVSEHLAEQARKARDRMPRPEAVVPTLLCGGADRALRDPSQPEQPLRRITAAPTGTGGVRELPVGYLIGRRSVLRTAAAVLRRTAQDREQVGDWAGLVLTGIGGIGKTAVAGRILARAREQGWAIAEHVGVWNPAALTADVASALAEHGHSELVDALRDRGHDDTTKLSLVLTALTRVRLVVLFDDFEQNLTAASEFLDPGFAEIFTAVCDHAQTGRVLVTCRYPIPGAESVLLRLELPALTPAELGRLLLRLPALRDLSTQDRKLVVRTIGGHPRLIEFLDVLLRKGTAAGFRHVTGKLHALAAREHIDLTAPRDLTTGISNAVRLGSRDILLDTITEELTPNQRELAHQAALARAAFTAEDLARTQHDTDPARDELAATVRDVERLRDFTLLSATSDDHLLMHPWVAGYFTHGQAGADTITRHQRGAAMRLRRLQAGRGGFDDVVDLIRHLAGSHNYDDAVDAAFQGCDVVGGEVAVAALLAEAVPLIPTNHPDYLVLADRECTALRTIGLTSATKNRRLHQLAISERLAATDSSNANYQRNLSNSHERLGSLTVAMGDIATAREHYQTGLDIVERLAAADPGNALYQQDLTISHNHLGDVAVAMGDIATARERFQAALDITERLAAADPGNAAYQRDLSISHEKLGNVAVRIGEVATAREHYQARLDITERLAAANPGNALYQRDLSISYGRLGDVALAIDAIATAREHYQAGFDITERLAAADRGNALYQQDLSISYDRLGEVAVAMGDIATARERFQAALDITERLAAADPGNAAYQRDLSSSHEKLGNVAVAMGEVATAREHYQTGLDIVERLAAADPGNALYQQELSMSHNHVGEMAVAMSEVATAREHYQAALNIVERFAAADPGNAAYQRELSISHEALGSLAVTMGDIATVREHYQAGFDITERLAAADRGNALYQRDLSISYGRLGDVALAIDDVTTAREHYQAGFDITERLAAADRGNALYQQDLSISYDRLGEVAVAMGDIATARERFQAALDITERLAAADPGNAGYQRDLTVSQERLHDLDKHR
ncbi:CHAT domain-containing protein [Lentzea sp. NPDC005914]|uniref:CHAT domain-containing protein n=1 Tax=Lentzea sp. NPDC005914 TaxID=3154572 RepID=UPI0033C717F7